MKLPALAPNMTVPHTLFLPEKKYLQGSVSLSSLFPFISLLEALSFLVAFIETGIQVI